MSFKIQTRRDVLALLSGFILIALGPLSKAEPNSKGVGPVHEVKLEEIKDDLAKTGKTVFIAKCSACHKLSERYVGPALKDVTKRRAPEWIMNMILNPTEMTQKDSTAQELLGEYLTQMTFQNVTESETRSILEYFRFYDTKGEIIDKAEKVIKTAAKKDKPTKMKK